MPEKYKKKGISSGLKLSGNGFSGFFSRFTFKASSWFTFSFILLIIIILICFGLWGYKINLDKDRETLAQQIEELEIQRDLDLESNFIELKEKIENFKKIIDKRIYSLNLLETFEELTLPWIQYNNFSADLTNLLVDLKVESDRYNSLAKQVIVFEEDSRIEDIVFSEVKLERSGLISSDLSLKLNSSFLHIK